VANLTIPDHLAQRLEEVAHAENRSIPDVLAQILATYVPVAEPIPEASQSESYNIALKEVRRKLYPVARRYWEEVGDTERLALTDEELDNQFWVIDREGIPRLKSEQGNIELPPDPLLIMAKAAEEAHLDFHEANISERSRDILNAEFADYLFRRMP
jgi:hypothetical protein